MIKITALEKVYRTDEVETIALNKLSIDIKKGEFVAVMGPSGCGKSTLLNILGLLDDPDSGSFLFNNIEVAHFNERKRADLRNHYPQQLSGGQQQRVAVARAVVNNPKLILADEPTGNLDSSNGNEVMALLTDLNEQGTTIIMVTHSEHDARYSHRIIRMLDGQTVTENILV